jgi:cysteine desulfurase
VDLLTLNGSKIYGPKGIGLLYVREGIKLEPQVCGGGHEHGRRSGTLNVPGIIGLAKALELAQAERENENKRLTCMRDKFIEKALELLPDIQLTGHTSDRLPNNISFMIKGVESEILLMRLDMEGIYASAGSACTAGNAEPSHVLLAMGFSKQEARTAVRFSLGHSTTEEELENVENMFIDAVKDIRSESGVY